VVLPSGDVREVRAWAPDPGERERLWDRFVALGTSAYPNANARERGRDLEPQAAAGRTGTRS
jgi:hypothetical protein